MFLLVMLVGMLVAVFEGATSSPLVTTKPGELFSVRRESEDGAVVAWSGLPNGNIPGAEAKFDITIDNKTDQVWSGRFCLQLMDQRLPEIISTLEQRTFALNPGTGSSDTITVKIPQDLTEGVYGLSLVVRRPDGAMVDLVPIQVGESTGVRRPTTQQAMDASLDACPPV